MKPVRLNHKLHLEAPLAVPDGAGGYRSGWQELGVMWGQLAPVAAEQRLSGEVAQFNNLYQLIIRAAPVGSERRPRIRQRFRLGTRIFRITSVTEHDTQGRYLACLGTEEQTS